MENRLTSGNIIHGIIRFSLPYLLACFLQVFYGLADLFIIGKFCGVDSTTAVSIGSQIMHMLTVIIVGLAMGSTVLIGKATGAQDRKLGNRAIGNTVTLFLIFSVLLTVILLILVHGIVSIMSTPAESVTGTTTYLVICFAGIPFITAYNIISSIFRGMGDSKSPMYFVIIACIFNIGLDVLFIGPLSMGPSGAALGTTIAQSISVVIAIAFIRRKHLLPGLAKEDFLPKKDILSTVLKVGIPVSLQDGLIQVSFMAITIFANMRGLDDAAAVGIVEKLISFLFLVNSAMLSTVSALGAQNIGAGREDRAKKILWYCMAICVGFGILVAVLMQFFAEPTVGLFTDSEAVILLGGQYMRAYILDTATAGMHFCFSGYFCAKEHSLISFAHNVSSMALVRIPVAWYTSTAFASLYPMGFSAPLGSFLSVMICIAAYIWLSRREKNLG